MINKLNQQIIKNLEDGMVDKVFSQLKELNEEEIKFFLKFLSDKLKLNCNKAIITPNVATVLKRKLKNDVNFEEFYQDWLPKVTPTYINDRAVYDYFSCPTRVINCKPVGNNDEFFTLALVYNPYKNLDELFANYKHDHNNTEESRKTVNQDNLESSELLGYCEILSDDIFGV